MADTQFAPPPISGDKGVDGFVPPPISGWKGPDIIKLDTNVREGLKNQGFLDSAWGTIKSLVGLPGSVLSGDFAKQGSAQIKRMKELDKSGTDEQKRAWAKETLLQNIPFASTMYKAFQGNVPGALGDVAGIATLVGLTKGATSETTANTLTGARAGISAAAPKVAMAGGAITAGELASKIPGMEWPARFAMLYPAGRLLVEAAKNGIEAGKQAIAERIAAQQAAKSAGTPLPTPVWQGGTKGTVSGMISPDPTVNVPTFYPQQHPMGMDIEGNMRPAALPSGRRVGPAFPIDTEAGRLASAQQAIIDFLRKQSK